MSVAWKTIRSDFEYVAKWWHDDEPDLFNECRRFAKPLWEKLLETKIIAKSATAADPDVKMWLLTILCLWRSYLLNRKTHLHPVFVDDWSAYADWVGLDAWFHHGLDVENEESDDVLDQVLAWDFDQRALEIHKHINIPNHLRHLLDTFVSSAESDDQRWYFSSGESFLELYESIEDLEYSLTEHLAKELEIQKSIRPIIVAASQLILNELRRKPQDVYNLPPRQFEEVIAEILGDQGYDIRLTPETKDGGYDIMAFSQTDEGEGLCLVEVKRYAKKNTVGIGYIRSLFGVLNDSAIADRAMLVSTSKFSREVKAFVSRHSYELELKDYSDVFSWLRKYGGSFRDDV